MATVVKQKKEIQVLKQNKSKHLTVKNTSIDSKKKTSNQEGLKKDIVVKKETPKKNDNIIDQEKAIKKYKDVPLGELYQELGGMRNYIEILEQRKKELLNAKSILDKNKRKIAIQKTIENTDDVKFKFQEATFRLHSIPTTTKLDVVKNSNEKNDGDSSQPNEFPTNRVMQHSEQRNIAPETKIVRQEFVRRNPFENKEVNLSSQMQRSDLRQVSPMAQSSQQPEQIQQTNMPVKNFGPQQQVPTQNITNVFIQQVAPQPGVPQPQQAPQPLVTPETKPLVAPQPIAQASGDVDVKPLYDKIHQIISKTKEPKVLYAFIVLVGVLLSLGVGFILIWGFASNWEFNGMQIGSDLKEFFTNLFNPSHWK